jgi:folate-dependent phosphoribosylglycinamide formyltransferase PurN
MRIVVLAEAAGPATRALLHLGLRGVSTVAVVVASRPTVAVAAELAAGVRARSPRRLAGTALRRLAALLDQPARFLSSGAFDGLAEQTVVTEPLNSAAMVRALESASPDLLVLAATALVNRAVLGVPRVATLNSHPALVPWVRGNGALEYAIRRRIPVGVSVHHVDDGADTGDVILRRLLPVTPADTLGSLRQKADELRWIALADVVRQFAAGPPPARVQQLRRFPSARWPTSAERAEAERLVTEGEAYRRYCAWRDLAGGDVLPDTDAAFDPQPFT